MSFLFSTKKELKIKKIEIFSLPKLYKPTTNRILNKDSNDHLTYDLLCKVQYWNTNYSKRGFNVV